MSSVRRPPQRRTPSSRRRCAAASMIAAIRRSRFWRLESFCATGRRLARRCCSLGVVLAVVFAPLISAHGPDEADNLAPPRRASARPAISLGTDQQGRDMLRGCCGAAACRCWWASCRRLSPARSGWRSDILAGFVRGLVDQVDHARASTCCSPFRWCCSR